MNKSTIVLLLFSLFFQNFLYGQKSDSVLVNAPPQFKPKSTYIPAALLVAGISAHAGREKSWDRQTVVERNEHLFGFSNHVDDYLQFSPVIAAYGFELGGMTPRTDWKNRTAILIKGQIVNLGLVYIMKKSFRSVRPDGTAYSFPSGHTANAFAGATLLSMEYGQNYKWVPYASYTLATGIGVMRVINNKHYISDVLFGAGLGILSMKAAYWTHQYRWNRKKQSADPFKVIYSQPDVVKN